MTSESESLMHIEDNYTMSDGIGQTKTLKGGLILSGFLFV